MVRRYCDICGKEVEKANEVWRLEMISREGNPSVSFDEKIDDVCAGCAAIIHCNVSMLQHDLEPEVTAEGMTVTEYNNKFLPKVDKDHVLLQI